MTIKTVGKQIIANVLDVRNRYFFALDVALLSALPALALSLSRGGTGWWAGAGPSLALYTGAGLLVKLALFYGLGLYRCCWRYASVGDLARILAGVGLATGILTVGSSSARAASLSALPFSLALLDGLLTGTVVAGSRLSVRGLYHWSRRLSRRVAGRRVLVVGAGEAGTLVVREMMVAHQLDMEPVAFVDDDPAKIGTMVNGLPVVGNCAQIPEVVHKHAIQQIVVAIPSAPLPRQKELVDVCERTGLATYCLPGLYQLLAGYKTISRLPEVDTQKLLRRDPIQLDQRELAAYLTGATVLVTGAGGSIGSELCRQIARYRPAQMILLGRGENSIFEINLNLRLSHPDLDAIPVNVDVRDRQRVDKIVDAYRPDVIFHAAAHKHVPLMEEAVDEALANNVLGTRNVVHAAEKYGVGRFVLISTDKAVNPSNVMGATKRLAELIVRDTARRSGRAYVAVRFGNVLGSRGSVIPIFQRQIAQGGPVTVTHPGMRRFFMTIPEAAQLVLGAGGMARGGEVYVLDMGDSVRIVDLARDLIKLAGLKLERDIQIVYSGIRPGEKLDEELFYSQEDHQRTSCKRIFSAADDGSLGLEGIERLVLDLLDQARQAETETERNEARELLLRVSRQPERYLPTLTPRPQVWSKQGSLAMPVSEVVSMNVAALAHIGGAPLSGAAA